MKINHSIFEQVKAAGARILVVTKYYEKERTKALINNIEQKYSSRIFGFGENRLEGIKDKGIDRSKLHFIGALQTKKLKVIAEYCSVIHSLDSLNHAERFDGILSSEEFRVKGLGLRVFLQVKLDRDKPTGIAPEDLEGFIKAMKAFKNLEVVGISGMGKRMSNVECRLPIETQKKIKQEEFQLLLDLRDEYLPEKLVSAGTTQDYQIALDMGIDVVRVGKGILL